MKSIRIDEQYTSAIEAILIKPFNDQRVDTPPAGDDEDAAVHK